jgi:hypothetical protein
MESKPTRTGECACCAYETALIEYHDGRRLCDLCAGTMAGVVSARPAAHGVAAGEMILLQALCYVGNAILEAIGSAVESR